MEEDKKKDIDNETVLMSEYEFWEYLGLSMGKYGLGEHMKKENEKNL